MIDWEQTRTVVTGGAGFIGSHLVDALLARDAKQVIVIDNFSRGHWENLPTEDIRLQVLNFDLSKHAPLLPEGAVVFHLAARVTNIQANQRDHLGMFLDNMAVNQSMARAVVEAKPMLYVAVSTVCVYPHEVSNPTHESEGYPFHPEPTNEGYGFAKAMQEKMGEYLHKEHGIPVIVPRFSNAIGPRDYYDWESSHVVPALIRKAYTYQQVVVWGSGRQSRVFVDARDIAKTLILLAENPEAADAKPINIGHDREVSIAALVTQILELTGQRKPVIFEREKPDGHARRLVDTSRLYRLIRWLPDTPLETTLADMIDEYRRGKAWT